jgi:CheY-like chemotaxis protein
MGQSKPFRRRTVLVVEIDREERHLAAALFEETGFRVVECASGEAAAALLSKMSREVALIFADARLGGRLDGVDFARLVNSRHPGIPVILAGDDFGDRSNQLPAGVQAMSKPWLALELLKKAEALQLTGAA